MEADLREPGLFRSYLGLARNPQEKEKVPVFA